MMKFKSLLFMTGLVCFCVVNVMRMPTARAADVPRYVAFEFNPLAPIAAARANATGNSVSMWDFGVDFNVAGKFCTGPEIWLGNFSISSEAQNEAERIRREDFQYTERQKLDATKINWNVSFFESGYAMRGWFVRAGYSYTKVNSKANRFYESQYGLDNAENVQSIVTDYRHGIYGSFGQRWHFWDHKASLTIGISYTHNFKRDINTESIDEDAEKDYLTLIEQIPDTRLSAKPMPTADLRLGFLF
ncbi:MAG: hypothetical protein R3B45_03360 [Bdellovibrionota bacterium]